MIENNSVPELHEGFELPTLEKAITQQNITLYAEASGDFNPVHVDEEFARTTPLGGTVAHGMLILAYVSEMMTHTFGRKWLTSGKLNVRFKDPARPGDTVRVTGKISRIEDIEGKRVVHCEVLCSGTGEEIYITGEATVEA